MDYSLATISPRIAARLNNRTQSVYNNGVLLPFAQDAADELQLELELYGILALEQISTVITLPASTLSFANLLPTDLLEPQFLEEKSVSDTYYFPVTRREFEPDLTAGTYLRYWSWRGQMIYTPGADNIRNVRLRYLKRAISIADENTLITVNNTQPFMINRIAALAARFVGENKTRSDELNGIAQAMLNKLIRIGIKNKQGTRTRRRMWTLPRHR